MKCLVHEKTTNRAALLYGVLGVAERTAHQVVLNAVNVANRTQRNYNVSLKEIIPLCYKELNLFIVNLQYVFSQHNKH